MAVTINGTTGIETNTDTGKIKVGASDDLVIERKTDDHSYINNSSGRLRIQGDDIRIEKADGSEFMAKFTADGSAELYHDDVKTFETISEGARVQGNEGASAVLELWADQGDDNADKWRLVSDQSSNYFYLQNYAAGSFETSIRALGNGNVELYFDNSLKFKTDSAGVQVYGAVIVDDGSATGNRISVGGAGDLKIYHESDNSYISNDTGHLIINSSATTNVDIMKAGHSEYMARFIPDGAVQLYYNNINVFSTTGAGIACGEIRSQTTYNATTSNSANMYIHSDPYVIYRSTSSIKYKDNVTTLTDADADKILNCRPVTYTSKCDIDDSNEIHYGLIAEEVKDVDSRLVVFEGTEPENVKYDRFVPHLINLVKRLTDEVDTLKTEKTKLQTDLTALTARVAALEAA